jgi:hypothetical protein
VPADRMQQGFEPYTYGVNLFRQYDGVNTVIFNQPVAKISYSKNIDDFDYDVDYTKSIQSAMKEAEEETQKQAEIHKKEVAEKTSSDQKKNAEELKKQKEADKSAAEELKKTQAEELAAKKAKEEEQRMDEKKKQTDAKEEAKNKKAAEVESGEEKKRLADVQQGSDPKPASDPASGDDQRNNKLIPGAGEDQKKKPAVASGADLKHTNAYMISGSDPHPAIKPEPVSGKDKPDKINETIDDGSVSVEEINEPNRTITKVTVKNAAGIKILYTKVAYNWGETYYFKNSTLSIPVYIYQLYTKMK